jgi:hypothetical protein
LLFMTARPGQGKTDQASTHNNARASNSGQRDYRSLQQDIIRSAKAAYVMRIAGTNHSFATDTGLMPYAIPSMRDPNRVRILAVIRVYIKAFFDQHLLEKTSSLMNGPSPDYPEVSFEKHK